MGKTAVFLNGPIGSGKTTLGRALARRIGGVFIDGDDYSDPGRPWYCSILRTSRAVVRATQDAFAVSDHAVIAYPLGCATWMFYRRHIEAVGARPVFVNLRASYPQIVAPGRLREFDAAEHARIRQMIAEGYAERPFADATIDTGTATVEETLVALLASLPEN
ncbi:shikimate kinase [Roseomonas aerophila]|uniref:Shikimate kinase n=1 Tax=Teichococcus aerophilus TaxID=1224513 RepID=A0ABR7RP81_9PROT|nr:shikimate kinase [Pseudoroseomonas aerophila]MBC9208382.1 shikimate kinase [Pseudoroseomonas aerophila]